MRRETERKPHVDAAHPKKVSYQDFSDDDFFGQFDAPAGTTGKRAEKEEALSLEDIFDDLRGDKK